MTWYDHVLIHAAAVYGFVGLYLSVPWVRDIQTDDKESAASKFWATLLIPIFALVMWPFFIDDEAKAQLTPRMKTKKNRAIREERKRLARELLRETASVEVLEMSADHRRAMAELHERRKKAEEVL